MKSSSSLVESAKAQTRTVMVKCHVVQWKDVEKRQGKSLHLFDKVIGAVV